MYNINFSNLYFYRRLRTIENVNLSLTRDLIVNFTNKKKNTCGIKNSNYLNNFNLLN